MSLKDRLANDFKEAMKAKDEVRKNTVNLVRAAVKQHEVDHRVELNDEEIVDVLAKQVKMRKDALSDFEKAGRMDLVDAYTQEISILMEYLPKQLSDEEVAEMVKITAQELSLEMTKQNMGKLIGGVMPKVKGVADGSAVRRIIDQMISS